MKFKLTALLGCALALNSLCISAKKPVYDLPTGINDVIIEDPFWSPKFKVWKEVTIPDVLDKFEGKHTDDPSRNDAFANFDKVAAGHVGTGDHFGAPWFDGLIYESIRGIADYLRMYPDPDLEQRIDHYIDRIVAAQSTDGSGYLSTQVQLNEPEHRWGDNGGFLRLQHDVYNAGMMIEAGVHYYKATGKTPLLEAAVRSANHMAMTMGPEPKRNIVPSHSGPEEAMLKLYQLFRGEPQLKSRLNTEVNPGDYLDLVTFWIENRGHHCGYPLWLSWGNDRSEQWIREAKYNDPSHGSHSRPTWGDYAQDSIPVFDQQTIEGHAVRATLLATGITALAMENRDPRYIATATRLWDNMVGRRMFITGGVGAIHHDEKFGPDYYLPSGAYLETCAAVGAAFFSQRMNELTRDAKYIDELERVLYNSLLTAVALRGDNYTYQNPLNADNHNRWEWHGCPCCPPMFLKITSCIQDYIYAIDKNDLYVNLFIGSTAFGTLDGRKNVNISQQTNYPWDGTTTISVDPSKPSRFALKVRIPGWALGVENPYGLYSSDLAERPVLKVNGKEVKMKVENGYASIKRTWAKGDKVELTLPVAPRVIKAHPEVKEMQGQACMAAGPVVYCFESVDNPDLGSISIGGSDDYRLEYAPELLGGVNIIKSADATAIPYYSIANRRRDTSHRVWRPTR